MTYDLMLILHFLGLALGLGASFAGFTLGLATKDLEPTERTKFLLRASAVGRNGSYGILLLIVSGVGFMVLSSAGAVFARGGGMFHAKLGLVVVLSGLLGYVQVLTKRAKQAQGGPTMATIPKVAGAMLLTGVAIVILAVRAFH